MIGGLAARVLAAAGAGADETAIPAGGELYGVEFRLDGARVFSNAAAEEVGCRAMRRLRRIRKAARAMRASPPMPPITPPTIAGVLEEEWEVEDGEEVDGNCVWAAAPAAMSSTEAGAVLESAVVVSEVSDEDGDGVSDATEEAAVGGRCPKPVC